MDDGGQNHNGKYKMEYLKAANSPWGFIPPSVREQNNALVMNKKIMAILAERDAAIQERNLALAEKNEALAARDEALQQREEALIERDKALMERDNALAAIQYRGNGINESGSKRIAREVYNPNEVVEALNAGEMHVTDAFPITTISAKSLKQCQPKQSKEKKAVSLKATKSTRRGSQVGEDLKREGGSDGKKFKAEWDSQDTGLNLVNFDRSTMPVPVCSCTGSPHQCYKWGNGGWQSSCCTTTMSCYPLPQMPNKRHARVGGRKMSGSVFRKLLSRFASEGHDLSVPLDLKDYWARHGTNRYITIK